MEDKKSKLLKTIVKESGRKTAAIVAPEEFDKEREGMLQRQKKFPQGHLKRLPWNDLMKPEDRIHRKRLRHEESELGVTTLV
jgi:hypothetical protein